MGVRHLTDIGLRLATGATVLTLLGGADVAGRSAQQIVDAAPVSAWETVPAGDLLVMTLGNGQRIVIALAPRFAPVHVANIRTLARAGWWDGASIVRVQDNYVVQWSQPADGHPAGVLPRGVNPHPPAEYERNADAVALRPLPYADSYAPVVGFADGWAVASDRRSVWLVHCYGMVGVGRDLPPDTGTGAELYAVIGQAPRHLDRNIALTGRVLDGMAALSALPRGTAALGFYGNPGQRIPIRRVVLAADLPLSERPAYQVMRTNTESFAEYIDARANRRDPFFIRPANAVDVCNVPVPARAEQ